MLPGFERGPCYLRPVELGISGRVALIAGASRGIGRQTAMVLAREGATVLLLARSRAPLEEAASEIQELGGRAVVVAADVRDRPALRASLDDLVSEVGAPALLVHAIAEVYAHQRLHTLDDDLSDALLSVDLGSAVTLSRWALPSMVRARFGRVVFVGSAAAHTGVAGGALYAAAKAGLEGLARGIALDYSRLGVTANVVSPSFVETERLALRTEGSPQAREHLARLTGTRRLVTPDEVAQAIAFLCSDGARSITGSVLEVSAGAHLANTL